MQTLKKLACMTATVLGASGLFASTALAETSTNPCGNIEFTSVGECHFEFEGGCKANCQPLSFVAACDGQCNAEVNVECTGSCTGGCQAECEANANFSCTTNCEADCETQVVAQCDSGDTECENYCRSSCSTECESSCQGSAELDCQGQCDMCCEGSCDANANFDCNISCSAELKGGCEIDCDAPEGALFCDGQYLAIQDIPACVEYLVENFEIEIEIEVEASASASVGGCSTSGTNNDFNPAALLGVAAAVGAVAARRRRKA